MKTAMVKLVEIHSVGSFSQTNDGPKENFSLRETWVNPKHVVFMRDDGQMWERIRDTSIGKNLDFGQSFTRLYISHGQNGLDIVVVGDLRQVEEKFKNCQELLKG